MTAMPAGARADWDDDALLTSRRALAACTQDADTSLAATDLILALRDGGRELLLLDAATLLTRAHCRLPLALEGTPLRAADGRALYLPAAQGWVLRLDLEQPQDLTAVRTGHALRGLALSADGRWLLAGHTRPDGLVLLDAQLQLVRSYRTTALAGGADSAVSSVWHSQARGSFMVAFESLPEWWELSYRPAAEPIYDGLVHDYRMAEAIATPGFLGVRRVPLQQPLAVVLADAPRRHLLGLALGPSAPGAPAEVDIINMDIRRRITTLPLPGQPAADAGVAFMSGATPWLALPLRPEGRVVLIEGGTWQRHPGLLASLQGVTLIRSHPAAPQLWLHATHSAPSDTLLLVDKQDFHQVTTLRETDRSWNMVGFSGGGRVAVLSSRGAQGELRLLDSRTLRELRRVPLPQVEAVFALDGPAPRTRPD